MLIVSSECDGGLGTQNDLATTNKNHRRVGVLVCEFTRTVNVGGLRDDERRTRCRREARVVNEAQLARPYMCMHALLLASSSPVSICVFDHPAGDMRGYVCLFVSLRYSDPDVVRVHFDFCSIHHNCSWPAMCISSSFVRLNHSEGHAIQNSPKTFSSSNTWSQS